MKYFLGPNGYAFFLANGVPEHMLHLVEPIPVPERSNVEIDWIAGCEVRLDGTVRYWKKSK